MSETQQNPVLYSSLAADPDFGELVGMYVDEMADRIATLEKAFDSRDMEKLGRTAHQIKGAAGGYGFETLTPLAAAVEFTVRDSEPEEKILQTLRALIRACRQVRAGVPE